MHYPAAQHDDFGGGHGEDRVAQLAEIGRNDRVRFVVVGQVGQRGPPALQDRRPAGEPFEAIAMRRTDPFKIAVRRMPPREQVPHLGMRRAVQSPAIDNQPAANPGAHGDIGERGQLAAGPESAFRQSGAIHIGVEADRNIECAREMAGKVAARPARFGRGPDMAPAAVRPIDHRRAETGDAERGQRALFAKPCFGLAQRGLGRARGEGVAREDFGGRMADCKDELGPARLDPAEQGPRAGHASIVCNNSQRSCLIVNCSSGAGTPPKRSATWEWSRGNSRPSMPQKSTKLDTISSREANQL